VVALIERTQAGKSTAQRLADRICGVFVPAVLAASALTLAGWLLAGIPVQPAFDPALAVLIIACPCALGLATPATLVVACGRGAELGILIRGHQFIKGHHQPLEASRTVDNRAAGQDRHTRHRADSLARQCAEWKQAGGTVVLPGWDGRARGALAVADAMQPSAGAAVAGLRGLGLRTVLLTGDSAAAARQIVGALPGDKLTVRKDLQASGRRVAMAGDRINDGPAPAAADLELALGTGADVAISASGMILPRSDLTVIPDAIRLARATLAAIRRNLAWAVGNNTAAIPLAAAGFLNRLIAGAAMAASSAFVVAGNVRLRRLAGAALAADQRAAVRELQAATARLAWAEEETA
jgi:P-type Cu+ transporter